MKKAEKLRKLTIEIIAEQPSANWIWQSLQCNTYDNGVKVESIWEGHIAKEGFENHEQDDTDAD